MFLVDHLSTRFFHKLFITFHGHESSDKPDQKAIFWHRLVINCVGAVLPLVVFTEILSG